MVLEGIVTTKNDDGGINIAPMGPLVDESMSTLTLRPFNTSHTYHNLRQQNCGVFHVVDDVLLLASAAIGALSSAPPMFPANVVDGAVLEAACRWYEFEIERFDDDNPRSTFRARVVHAGRIRDFFGFNRAKHAVLEAAILATRVAMIERTEIIEQLSLLKVPVEKTAGQQEREAFEILERYVLEYDVVEQS